MQAETQLGECMLYNLAEWAREQIPHWLEQSIVERSMPAAAAAPAAESQAAAKEVWQQDTCDDNHGAASSSLFISGSIAFLFKAFVYLWRNGRFVEQT